MKAKQRTLAFLLALVLAAGVALALLTHANRKAEQAASEAEDGSIPLLDVTGDTLEQVAVQYEGETLTLLPGDGWTLAEDPDYHLDDSACDTIRTALADMRAKRQLEAQPGEDYGFGTPRLVVNVTAAGERTTLTVGAENPVTGDVYVRRNGEDTVYAVVWALTRQMEQGDFKPAGYEFKFGSGKIDRIDTCEDENRVYVKVTDYKTGRKVFDITSFYHGLQLQLPVYLNAALEAEGKRYPGKEIVPAGIFYYRIQDPIVAREKTDKKTEESILKELKLDGLVNGEEEVIEHLEANLTGSSLYYPLRRNQNGLLGSTSKALPQEKFETVLAYTRSKQKELKAEMYEGEVSALPYLLGEDTGCDFCACKDICGFDQRIEGCEYRQLQKYSLEEAVECMKEKLGIKKSQK